MLADQHVTEQMQWWKFQEERQDNNCHEVKNMIDLKEKKS
jgi:hypothetical protein